MKDTEKNYFENFLKIPYHFGLPVEYIDYFPKVFVAVRYISVAEKVNLKPSDLISIVCYLKNFGTFILPYKYKDDFINFLKSGKIEDLPFEFQKNTFRNGEIITFKIPGYLSDEEQIKTLEIRKPEDFDYSVLQ